MEEQFDLIEALDRKEKGLADVASNNVRFLNVARKIAKSLARIKGEITADDVREVCPLDPTSSNVWGNLFRTKDWEPTGAFRRSKLVQGHGNPQHVWRLKRKQ